MSVPNEVYKNRYSGNGATDEFAYSFRIIDDDEILVQVADADDVATTLVKTSQYTVSGVEELAGGNVTLGDLTAVTGFYFLPATWTVTLIRNQPLTQLTELSNQGNFRPHTVEYAIDKTVMIAQGLQEQLDRCPKVTSTSGDTGDAYLTTIEADVAASAASAAAASVSEGNAATSETNAGNSAAAALVSENNAATSETNAGNSETNASNSAAAALNSENNASASEINAAASAAAALVSENNASTSEGNASGSAAAALVSENNASTSETNAGISEVNASNSAAAALVSENNAATSESNAAASAAGVNLPAIGVGDAGKTLEVNALETGYQLTAAGYVPIGTILPYYDFDAAVSVDTNYWAYCDGSVVNNAASPFHTMTLPDLSNRYLVGFGTEGGGDIETALWNTGVVGNADHEVNLQHNHDTNIGSFTSGSESSHTHGVSGTTAIEAQGPQLEGSGPRECAVDNHTHTFSVTSGSGSSHSHSVNPPNTTSDNALTTTEDMQPRSIRVRYIMRIA